MSNKDSLTDVLSLAIRSELSELNTCAPAQIISYDYKAQKASVQPSINRRYADGEVRPFPIINNVPVIFPRSGGATLTFPVKNGDTVLLMFAGRSIDAWLKKGGTVDQDDTRMHDLNDAIAIPGLMPFSQSSGAKNNDDVLLAFGGNEVELKPGGEVNISSPTKITMTTPLVQIDGELIVKENISDLNKALGTFNNIRDVYDNHTHNETNIVTAIPNQPLGS